jgi:hypothetical protein
VSGTDEPIAQALARLVQEGTLTPPQADAVRREVEAVTAARPVAPAGGSVSPGPGSTGWAPILAEIGGYIGATFVVAAAVVLTGPNWGGLSTGERLAVLLAPAALLTLAGLVVGRGTPGGWAGLSRAEVGPRRRLVSVLFGVVGGLVAGAVGVVTEAPEESVLVSTTALLAFLAGYVVLRTVVLHVAAAFAAVGAAASLSSLIFRDAGEAVAGAFLIGLALLWWAATAAGWFRETHLGAAISGANAFVGAELIAVSGRDAHGLGYLALLMLAVACFAGYVRARFVAVLVVGVVALATVVPQAVLDYTDGALNASGGLLLTGLSIVAASALGLRVRRTAPDPT